MRMYNFFKRQYLFWKKENDSVTPVPFADKINSVMKGFNSESKVIYDLNNKKSTDYLSDYNRLKTYVINGDYGYALKNKLLFESIFKNILPLAKNIAIIHDGRIIPIGKNKVNDFSSLLKYLKINGKMVLKPTTGSGGAGILFLSWENQIFLNNEPKTVEEFQNILSSLKDYFVNEYIEQGEFGNSLNNTSLNTIRILTLQDIETNEPFIPIAVQRIGNKKSSPTDNWSRGGFSASIDLDTGELGKAVSHPDSSKELNWYKYHPDNNNIIQGKKIPQWDYIKNKILLAASQTPFFPYIGWDVVITDNGFIVIEGNSMSDVDLLQIHEPLLSNPKVKSFFDYYEIL